MYLRYPPIFSAPGQLFQVSSNCCPAFPWVSQLSSFFGKAMIPFQRQIHPLKSPKSWKTGKPIEKLDNSWARPGRAGRDDVQLVQVSSSCCPAFPLVFQLSSFFGKTKLPCKDRSIPGNLQKAGKLENQWKSWSTAGRDLEELDETWKSSNS